MTVFLLANTVFLLASVAYGWLAGDRHDREAVAWIIAAIIGTATVRAFAPPNSRELIVMVIDLALLAAMISVALRSQRYWPVWFSALHFVGVLSTALTVSGHALDVMVRISGLWGTAALLAMVGGLFLDNRANARAARLSRVIFRG